MTIDASKTSPEKLAEMNDSLITDNRYLRGRVAELTSQMNEVVLAIPGTRYMDPPDGGDVSLGEQVRRMALDLGAKQAEIDRLMIEQMRETILTKVTDQKYSDPCSVQERNWNAGVGSALVAIRKLTFLQPSPEILEARDRRIAEACGKVVIADNGQCDAHVLASQLICGEWRKYL